MKDATIELRKLNYERVGRGRKLMRKYEEFFDSRYNGDLACMVADAIADILHALKTEVSDEAVEITLRRAHQYFQSECELLENRDPCEELREEAPF